MSRGRLFCNTGSFVYLAGVLFSTGCGTPLVYPFFPLTGAHGVVLDQYDNPVPNCDMEASWVPASWGFIMMPPMHVDKFCTDQQGKWKYYRRDADDLDIAARPPNGYEVYGHVRLFTAGSFKNGQCPTNDFILRLRKIESTQSPKEVQ